jgi:predicted short-subunit dehydrogenase-like oxidoreductase (DUF2520 family)
LPSEKFNIAIIGAGKIAYSLTAALKHSGYNLTCVISRNIKSAEKLSLSFKIKKCSNDLRYIPKNCNFFILSVPDGEIKNTAQSLAKLNLNFRESIFIHLSGSENISALNSIQKKGGKTASLHIMQTFPSMQTVSIKNSYAAIEANGRQTKKALTELAKKLDLIPFYVKTELKTLYHLSGVFASNFLTGNLYSSELLLGQNFYKILEPIILSTLKSIQQNGTEKSLSGPIQRGDLKTIKNHLRSLKKLKNKELLLSYISQSLNILKLVSPHHFKASHKQIRKLLEKEIASVF